MRRSILSSLVLFSALLASVGCNPVQQGGASLSAVTGDGAKLPGESPAMPAQTAEPADSANPFDEQQLVETSALLPAEDTAPVALAATQNSSGEIPVLNCMVEGVDDIRVSAAVDGVITQLKVEEGSLVNEDEVLALIDLEQAQLTLELKRAEEEQARLQATNDVNIRAAKKASEFENAEAKSTEELYKKQAAPFWDWQRELLEAQRSVLAIELAENEQLVAKATHTAKTAERKLAEYEIARREVKASFSGVIATRFAKQGEWVQAGMPIVRVVRLDTVKIEGDVNPQTAPNGIFIGAPVKIRIQVSAGVVKEFDSTLGYVSPILDGDGTYRVWAKINNEVNNGRYMVSPGMKAEMSIVPTTPVALN